jgi:two-component system sensor kinase FixL
MARALARRLGRAWSRLAEGVLFLVRRGEVERRARESEERLRLALDAAGMAIWEMDATTGEMWWSAEAGRLFGVDDDGETARTKLSHVVDRIHPEDRAAFQAAVAEAVAQAGEVHRVQARVVWPDGTVRWMEARGQSWLDAAGELRGLRGTLVDVTELKHVEEERLRGEEALRRSSELYRAYFTASPLAVFVSDTRGRYLEVNGAATALTGYSREELLQMRIHDLLVTGGAAGLEDRLVGLLALGDGRHEVQIRRKDGSARHCLVHATAIGAERRLGFLLDVTDRQEAEEKLRESEARYRGLSEASLEAILVHDGGRIVDVNHALCKLGGFSWHELVGRDAFELIAPEDRETVYRALLTEYSGTYEVTGLRRDGARIPLEVRARTFPFRGQNLRVVAIRDVSERRRAERVRESLISNLEAKNAELEAFTHTVSHDLKAPLITIRGFADYLLRDVDEGRLDRVRADARRIADAAAQMRLLLDHLVELSQAGRGAGPPAAVPLETAVAEALRLVEGRRARSGVHVDLGKGLPVVFGDHSRLVQLFQNLLDNAVKFSAGVDEPRVTVEVAPGAPGEATVVVRDNGRGIPPAHHQRVFGLFEKLDPRTEGTGVGLAVVKRIVESHGGRARVESRGAGCGTEVWVTLPTPPEEGQDASKRTFTGAAERPAG